MTFSYCAFSGYYTAIRFSEGSIGIIDRCAFVHCTSYVTQARDTCYVNVTNTLYAYNTNASALYSANNGYIICGTVDLFSNFKSVIVTQNSYAALYTTTCEAQTSWNFSISRQAGLTLNTVSFVQGGGGTLGITASHLSYASYYNCTMDAAFTISVYRTSLTEKLGTLTGTPTYIPALNTVGAFGEYNF